MAKDKKTIKYEADISGFKKNIETANNNIKTLNNTLKLNQTQLNGNKNSVQLLSERVELLKQKYNEQVSVIENTRAEYEKAVEVYGENSKEAENLKNKLIQAETKQQSIANAIKQTNEQLAVQLSKFISAGDNMTEYGETVNKIGNKVESAGNKLSILSAGVATLAGASVKASIDYESAWTGVTKTVDGTEEQLSDLRQGILDLSTQLPSAATEIAGVAENAGQLGIATENVLDFTKVMIDLGNSTNLSADEASTAIAQLYNIMGSDINTVDKFGAALVDLGNNAATTEADILNMATRIASSATQVGLTEQQMLALSTTLASVGLEAEGGGSAISTVITTIDKAVALNSKTLSTWAETAGMSTKQFKTAWETDTMGAIQAVIKGMGDASAGGENLNVILDELGVTSIRQTDTMKRLSSASELLGKMVTISNEAWEENTALSNEANKRYETTESKLEMLKNEIVANGIALGDELKPALIEVLEEVKPIISNVTSLAKSFNNLDDATKKQIINMGAAIVAAGPALKIGGKLITSLGNGVKSVGTLTKAIGVMKTGVNSGTKEVDSLAKTLTTFAANPTTLAIGAVTALCAAYAAWYIAETKQKASLGGLREEVENQKEAWEKLEETRQTSLSSSMTEIETYEKLSEELKQITDENGNVKQGYEERAQTILGILSEALGTEYTMTDNIIDKYQDLQAEIDKTIAAKKAEAVLSAYQEEYATAIKEQTTATEALVGLKQKLAEAAEKMATGSEKERKEAEIQYSSIAQQIGEQTELISKYGKTIQDYENLQTASAEGTADAIDKAIAQIGTSYDTLKQESEQSIEQQIINQGEYVKLLKQSWQEAVDSNDTYQAEILNTQLETQQQELANLADTLAKQTSSVTELSQEQINAWKTLAEQSYSEYNKALSEVGPTTAQKIQEATGIVSTDTSFTEALGNEGSQATMLFENNLKLSDKAKTETENTATEMNNNTSVEDAAEGLAEDANTGFNSNVDGSTWGSDLSNEISKGMTNSQSKSWIESAGETVAGWISNFLHFSLPEKGPLSDMDKSMPDMIDLMVDGIKNNKYKVVSSVKSLSQEMKEQMNFTNIPRLQGYSNSLSGFNNQIVERTSTIFTTPQIVFNVQELDEAKLEQCFNYVNKKFGSQY